jgi:SAM-dependent methyltransferase
MIFDEDALNYDRYRPTYVQELFDNVIAYSGLDGSKKALEIGVGTGQATVPLLETGCAITAIEPGPNLAAYAGDKLAGYNNFRVINVDFESLPVERQAYDLVYSATAFHWIPQDLGLLKVLELLKPGGALALFWNHPFVSRKDDSLHVQIQEVYNRYRPPDRPLTEFDGSTCRQYADTLSGYGFTDIVTRIYRGTRILTSSDYVGLLNTYSDHRAMAGDARAGLEAGVRAAIDRHGGSIRIRDTMDLYLAREP